MIFLHSGTNSLNVKFLHSVSHPRLERGWHTVEGGSKSSQTNSGKMHLFSGHFCPILDSLDSILGDNIFILFLT